MLYFSLGFIFSILVYLACTLGYLFFPAFRPCGLSEALYRGLFFFVFFYTHCIRLLFPPPPAALLPFLPLDFISIHIYTYIHTYGAQ